MIPVVAACLIYEDKVLVAQKSEQSDLPLKWEFPGGKIKPGESDFRALCRELKEELEIQIHADSIAQFLGEFPYTYPHIKICLKAYVLRVESSEFQVKEHADARWVDPRELIELDFAEADRLILKALLRTIDLM